MQKYCLSRPIKNKQGNRSIIGIGKSDWPGADYTKEPWGQSKRFANGYDGRGGQYEAMDMLILGQHRAMDILEGGEGSIKMFRQSGLTTMIFSCS